MFNLVISIMVLFIVVDVLIINLFSGCILILLLGNSIFKFVLGMFWKSFIMVELGLKVIGVCFFFLK